MRKLTKLKILIKQILSKITENPSYENTTWYEEEEQEILELAKSLKYDFELDDEAVEYFLKATILEVWEYWDKQIMPNWKSRLKTNWPPQEEAIISSTGMSYPQPFYP